MYIVETDLGYSYKHIYILTTTHGSVVENIPDSAFYEAQTGYKSLDKQCYKT